MQAKLSFNHLNTFATAAQTLSFQQAASLLHVTPSAVSHQVRSLEERLGYSLFERLDKQIRLTAEGTRFYQQIREPLQQLHAASAKALRRSEDNHLTLSVAPVFATRWLLPRLKNFHAQHPEINLSILATTQLVDLRVEPVDAVIRMGMGPWPGTNGQKLFERCLIAVCHPRLLAAQGGDFLTPEQVAQQPLIYNAAMPGLWEAWFAAAGIKTPSHRGLEVDSSAQTLESLDSTDAIGLVDLLFVADELTAGRLALACQHQLTGYESGFLLYPDNKPVSAALQTFSAWLLAQLEDAPPGGQKPS